MDNEYITITQLNHYIKEVFDDNTFLNKIYLMGEISNFKAHTRGHLYFTLKDDNSRINAVMFSYNTNKLKFQYMKQLVLIRYMLKICSKMVLEIFM